MKKIFKEEQLKTLGEYPKKVVEVIAILDENYGEVRDVDKELGGYVYL